MGRLLALVALYAIMFLGWTSGGLFMLLAPVRMGTILHDSFGLFPEVSARDRGNKLVIRLMGLALLGFAAHFAQLVAALFSGS